MLTWDARRDYIVPGSKDETVSFAAEHWIHTAERSIQQRGKFSVALSGGSTPKSIFELITRSKKIDWSRVWLYWSDERAVPPDHAESNYGMAMAAGFSSLPIPPNQIFRMKAEKEIEKNSADYEEKIRHLAPHFFDLVMLGCGEDGHTASLFPNSAAINENIRLVAANYISEKKVWRMTLTYPCINQSYLSVIYAIGPTKELIVPKILNAAIDSPFPCSRIGTEAHKALWILDKDAANQLK